MEGVAGFGKCAKQLLSHGTEVLPVVVPESTTNDVRATVYGAKFLVFEYSQVLFAHPYSLALTNKPHSHKLLGE